VHLAKRRGEANKVESLMLVAIWVLQKDRAITGKEVKGGSKTSSRLVKGASSTILDSMGSEDSQSS